MADLSELVITGAQKSVSGIGDDVAKGAELAIRAEQVASQKAAAQAKMQELQSAKYEKFMDALQKGGAYKGTARSNYFNKIMPQYRDSLGLTKDFPDEMIKFTTADDDQISRMQTIIAQVRSGEMTEAQGIKLMNDPISFGELTPEIKENFYGQAGDAAKIAIDAQAKTAQMTQSANQFATSQNATSTRDRLDRREKASKEIADKLVLEFQADINTLDAGIPGGIKGFKGGNIPGISGDQGKMPGSELSGTAAQNRQALQRLVNAQLKEFSGASLTDNELKNQLEGLGISTQYLNGGWTANILTGLKKSPSPEKVLQGIRYLERRQANKVKRIQNTFGKDIYDEAVAGTDTGSLAVGGGAPQPQSAIEKGVGAVDALADTINAKFPDITKVDPARLKQILAKKHTPTDISAAFKKLGIKE